MVSKILMIVLIVSTASAATWRRNLANNQGCYVNDIDDFIEVGETVVPSIGNCYKIHCLPQFIVHALCRAVYTDDPKCYKTEKDLSKPYPSCCPTIKCDSNNHIR